MSVYLIIDLCIIAIPLFLTFEKNVAYYSKLKNVFKSILIVGIIFLLWDAIATNRGDWSFNKNYTGSFEIFDLPLEEILFFITVPYSIIFIYESFGFYLKDKNFNIPKIIYLITGILFFVAGGLNFDKNYTAIVLIYCGIVFTLTFLLGGSVFSSRIFLSTILISYIPFIIVNYILTSLPVVEYNPEAILGIRITTIPVEDFFYSFGMISSWLLVYDYFKKKQVTFK